MAINDALLTIGAQAMADAAVYAAIHTAQPNASGSNESAADRVEIDWSSAADGDVAIASDLEFTGGTPSGAATHIGFWSAATSGTFYGWLALTGDQTFNAAGEYTVTAITLTGSAS